MMRQRGREKFQALLRAELLHITRINPSSRPWQMPFTAALASGLPLLLGAAFNHLDYGLIASLAGLVFLYLPNTPLPQRMVFLLACALGMWLSYALGLVSHFLQPLMVLVLTLIAILVTMAVRFYNVGPPGSLFFVMAAAIGAYSPVELSQLPLHVGMFALGSLLATLLALLYSIHILRLQPVQPVTPLPPASFDFVIFDSVVIGLFVGISLALAEALRLERAYWVPISCVAVIQGLSLRGVWNKQIHRIAGTGIGLLLSWALLALPLDKWSVALMIIALTFIIETLVVRHYGLAVIFITPLTIFLAEAATLGHGSSAAMIQARFWDTVLGSVVGLIGGVCLHSPTFRAVAGRQLKRLIPSRLLP